MTAAELQTLLLADAARLLAHTWTVTGDVRKRAEALKLLVASLPEAELHRLLTFYESQP